MLTVRDLLRLCQYCDHTIVVYNERATDDPSDTYGELLWTSESGLDLPSDVASMHVLGYDLEAAFYRIWVDDGRAKLKFTYKDWEVEDQIQDIEYYN